MGLTLLVPFINNMEPSLLFTLLIPRVQPVDDGKESKEEWLGPERYMLPSALFWYGLTQASKENVDPVIAYMLPLDLIK
jgi:hypothetical protein